MIAFRSYGSTKAPAVPLPRIGPIPVDLIGQMLPPLLPRRSTNPARHSGRIAPGDEVTHAVGVLRRVTAVARRQGDSAHIRVDREVGNSGGIARAGGAGQTGKVSSVGFRKPGFRITEQLQCKLDCRVRVRNGLSSARLVQHALTEGIPVGGPAVDRMGSHSPRPTQCSPTRRPRWSWRNLTSMARWAKKNSCRHSPRCKPRTTPDRPTRAGNSSMVPRSPMNVTAFTVLIARAATRRHAARSSPGRQ